LQEAFVDLSVLWSCIGTVNSAGLSALTPTDRGEQDPAGIGTVGDQMGDPVSHGIGLMFR
jgi:hypothetical protein